jgi:peroxiredoxin
MKISNIFAKGLLAGLVLSASLTSAGAQDQYKEVEEVRGLEKGVQIEDFSTVDMAGNTVALSDLLAEGPVVLVFYRGVWCPLCNQHLSELQDNLQRIEKHGASVVAVSPERPEFLRQTAEKTGAEFILLYDEDYRISKLFDVAFMPDEETIGMLGDMLDVDLTEPHSDDSRRLPVPATYIIDENSKVAWRHFDPDYRNRSGVDQIIDNLPNR